MEELRILHRALGRFRPLLRHLELGYDLPLFETRFRSLKAFKGLRTLQINEFRRDDDFEADDLDISRPRDQIPLTNFLQSMPNLTLIYRPHPVVREISEDEPRITRSWVFLDGTTIAVVADDDDDDAAGWYEAEGVKKEVKVELSGDYEDTHRTWHIVLVDGRATAFLKSTEVKVRRSAWTLRYT